MKQADVYNTNKYNRIFSFYNNISDNHFFN